MIFDPVTKTVKLYIDNDKIESIKEYLESIKVEVRSYTQIDEDLSAMAKTEGAKIKIHANTCNAHLTNIVKDIKVVCEDNPI